MTCPSCQAVVPDESAFCLACGARLATRAAPANGHGSESARPSVVGTEAVAVPPAPAGRRQAYALSFGPLVDDRLRYKVAKWVVARAPAYPLTEVQDGLQHGTFVAVLAFTAEEAETARQGIHGLGVSPALLRLTPATTVDVLLPARSTRPAARKRAVGLGDWRTLVAAGLGLLVFGYVVARLIGGRAF